MNSPVPVNCLPARCAACCCVLLLGWTSPAQSPLPQGALAAEPSRAGAHPQIVTEELKALSDPTIMERRVWLETEWNNYKDGSDNLEETLGGLWAWKISTRQDWGVRLKMPYEWHIAGEAAGDANANGLGDLKLATGTAFRLSPTWRTAAGLELRMPTATDDLGDGDWRLQEFGALACDVTKWLTLSPSLEYNQSLAEVHGAPPQHYLELFLPVTFLLPHRWAVSARYEAKVDFENANEVIQSARLQLAKELADLPLAFALSVKKPFDGGQKQLQLNFTITCFFR